MERLLRRSADALLLAMTIIFPSLRASRLSVIASQPAKQSLPSVPNDLARLPRRSAIASLLAMIIIPFRPRVARLSPCSSQRLQAFRHCEPAGFLSLRDSRRGNLSPRVLANHLSSVIASQFSSVLASQ